MTKDFTLRSHQEAMIDFSYGVDNSLIYSPMGSGKTLVALLWLGQFPGPKIVITPKPVIPVWREDDMKFTEYGNLVLLNKGSTDRKARKLYDNPSATFVVNPETAKLLPLEDIPFSAAVVDEAHRLGAYNSQQSIQLAKSMADIENKMSMTGTPFEDGIEKIYGMARWLDPVIFDHPKKYPQARIFGHWDDFVDNFCYYRQEGYAKLIFGYKNLEELAKLIDPFTLRIYDIELPELVTLKVPVELENKRAYNQLVKENVIEIDGNLEIVVKHQLEKLIRLQQMVSNGTMETIDGVKKYFSIKNRENALKELLEQIGDEPVVIMTRFKRDVEVIENILDEEVSLLTGDVDNHQEWRDGKNRILIANIGAGSLGVRLERARRIIFWSIGYSNQEFKQAHGRIQRDGQESDTVYAYYLVTENSIDEQIYKALEDKNSTKEAFDALLSNSFSGSGSTNS